MRPFERLVIGSLVVAVVFVATFWYLDRRPGSMHRLGEAAVAGAFAAAPPPTSPAPTSTTVPPDGFTLPLDPRPLRIAWAGDSLAGSLADAVVAAGAARGIEIVTQATPGCGMVRGLPADDALVPIPWAATCDANVGAHNLGVAALGADVITWLSTWETANRIVDGTTYVFGTPEGDATFLRLLDESVGQLTAGGARLVFLTIPPSTTSPTRPTRNLEGEERAGHLDALLRQYARADADRVAVLDLAALVCPGGPPCPTAVDGVTLRPDDGAHFAGDGPAWVAPRVLDALTGPA